MKRACLFAAILACGMAASTLLAQPKPDFSGRWTTNPDPASAVSAAAPARGGGGARGRQGGGRGRGAVSGDMGSGWGSTITLDQNATSLTLEYDFFVRGDLQPPLTFSYRLDGSETRNTVRMGRGLQVQTSKTAWDGNTLIITTTHTYADAVSGAPMTTEVIRRLSLESPTSLVVETIRAAVPGGEASTVRTVYRKI